VKFKLEVGIDEGEGWWDIAERSRHAFERRT